MNPLLPKIGTLINFCTNEHRFLADGIEQALKFSSEVVVVVASHFFDGTEENRPLLDSIYRSFPQVKFVEYPFCPAVIPPSCFRTIRKEAFWHSLSRWVGVSTLSPTVDWVLFLDAEEVADGERVVSWLQSTPDLQRQNVLKLANAWYFREPIYQATTFEDSILLVPKNNISQELVLHSKERDALYDLLPAPKKRGVLGADNAPLFHHFSWVRSEEEMLKKVRSWGHKGDRDWEALVRQEFRAPFNGTDFVHGYKYRTVLCPFRLEGIPLTTSPSTTHVLKLNEKDLLALLSSRKRPLWDRICRLLRKDG